MKAYRVWGVIKDGVEIIASTAYEKRERAQEICDRLNEKYDWATHEVREEEVPGHVVVNGNKYKVNIVVMGDDQEHTRF